jgi:hypothetical protein
LIFSEKSPPIPGFNYASWRKARHCEVKIRHFPTLPNRRVP